MSRTLALVLVAGLTAVGCTAQAPVVEKVEPPCWWIDHTHNPVRLLITGRNLQDAALTAPSGFEVGNVRISENGDYLFADLSIPTDASPGSVPLEVTRNGGTEAVPFELLPELTRAGRFTGFSPDDVIYLAMTDRFANGDPENDEPVGSEGMMDRSKPRHYHGGDLQGVIDRLDYLVDLGITAIWLTPWYDNANDLNHVEKYTTDNKLSSNGIPSTDYHGYGAVDFYSVEEHFGDMEVLREFVRQAQDRGIKVIQDQIANHSGPLHPWVRNPPTPTWYNGSLSNHLANSWQIWTTTVSNPPADKLESTLSGWFLDILPDFNQDDPELATYLIQNSLWWVGMTGVDAVRQDTMPYVPRQFWAQWTSALDRQHPDLTILGEVLDGDPKAVSFYQGGAPRFDGIDSGVHTLFDFPLYYGVMDVFARDHPMTRLTDLLAADSNYVDADVLVTLLGLHDKPRFLHEANGSVEGLKLAFTFLCTTRGTPLIYYGDEVGLTGEKDPYNRKDFPGGWPEDVQDAFDASHRTEVQQDIHGHLAQVLSLRQELEPLRRGDLVNLEVGADTYTYARVTADSFVVVALNNSAQPQKVSLSLAGLDRPGVSMLTDRLGGIGSVGVIGGEASFTLAPKSAALLAPGPALAKARGREDLGTEQQAPTRAVTRP